jgi:hypothetical protein
MALMQTNLTYRLVDNQKILGKLLPAFIHNGGDYFLINIAVYADGMIYCWEWVDIDVFIEKLKSGRVVTTLPEDANVSIHHVIYFSVKNVLFSVPESEFLKEILDVIEELNDRPTSLHNFIQAKKQCWDEPNEENRKIMHETFEKIPHHRKKYVLNERDHRYFKEQGIKTYRTVWELKENNQTEL